MSLCVFCEIPIKNRNSILYEDDLIIIIKDINPIAHIHLQCIPKIHIKNINSLTYKFISLIEHMKEESINYITKNYDKVNREDIIQGFHIPPFYTVKHLHLHCIVPPYKNCCLKIFKINCIMRRVDVVLAKLKRDEKPEIIVG